MIANAGLKRSPGLAVPEEHAAMPRAELATVEIGLNAAIVAVNADEPMALIVRDESEGAVDGLPFGPFSPVQHRTLEGGLRTWVAEQTGLELGYVEQLYTFGDRGRHAEVADESPHIVSIGYLALSETSQFQELQRGAWRSWYHYFPWEDWRRGRPEILQKEIEPRLREWAQRPPTRSAPVRPVTREDRARMCFGIDGGTWDEEKVLDRYELLYEAGLVDEARRDGREAAVTWAPRPRLGAQMRFDHRRILATAIGRVRAKIKYRPVIFELMSDEFTL